MSLGTSNRDGGRTSESGHLRALAKMVNGDVLAGLAVSQRGAGANMSVDVAIGDALVRRSDGTYAHPVFNDAVYNQVITTADVSNPRRDLVVLYVDYGQTPSTGVSNNTNGVVKIKVVAGTPAGSPADPSGAAVQASVGAGNPYTVLARVRVAAGASSITNSVIDDLRTMVTALTNFVNSASIIDGSVAYADLLATIFSSQIQSYTNTGSGGGTCYYINLGGLKMAFGTTGTFSTAAGANYYASLPVGFFSAVYGGSIFNPSSSAVISQVGSNLVTTAIQQYIQTVSSNVKISFIVIGV